MALSMKADSLSHQVTCAVMYTALAWLLGLKGAP